jgi:hypothetical protein
MQRLARARLQIVGVGLVLFGCRTSVAGHYRLDLEETKLCVAAAVVDDPKVAEMKAETIRMLAATDLDLELNGTGKMLSNTTYKGPPPQQQSRSGTWKLDGKRVKIAVEDEPDTICEVDGNRLRCTKPDAATLFSRYVLVRK